MSRRKKMTKSEFKKRWESGDDGGGINYDDIADCAKEWGIAARPMIMPIHLVRYRVLKAAGTNDAEDFAPEEMEG